MRARLVVTLSHMTDHRIKPSSINRVSVGRDADSAFPAAANEKESADKHKLTFKGFLTLSSGASTKILL